MSKQPEEKSDRQGAVRTQTIRIDERDVQLHTAGAAGPALILMHGGFCDTAMLSWGPHLPALGARYRVFAFDFPGFGGSALPASAPSTLDYYCRFLDKLRAQLGLERAVFGGISMGGLAALAYACHRPAAVDGLILIGTGGLTGTFPRMQAAYWATRNLGLYAAVMGRILRRRGFVRHGIRRMVHDPSVITPELEAEICRLASRPESVKVFGEFAKDQLLPGGRLRGDFRAQLPTVTCPVLVVHGAKDYFYPAAEIAAAARQLPNARLEIIDGCGHWVNVERPARLVELMLEAHRPS